MLMLQDKLPSSQFPGSCLNHLIETLPETNFTYTINLEWYLEQPSIRLDLSKPFWLTSERSDIVIIKLNGQSLKTVLQRIVNQPFFNPRGTTIVITNQVKFFDFKAASSFYINKLIVLEEQSDTHQTIYSYQPYRFGNVNNPSVVFSTWGTCTNGKLTLKKKAIKPKLPRKWPNTTIRALNNIVPPYAICPTCTIDRGIEIEVFDIIAQCLQLQVTYTRNEFAYWGSKSNGTYSHIYGELQRREGDMAVGVFHSKFDEHLDFDMSYSYMEDSTRWLVPKAKILPYWKRLSLIFAKEVYLSVIFSIFLMVVVYRLFHNASYSSSWIMLYQILLELSLKQLPFNFRSVTMAWIASCLILSTMFKSKLIDIMSKDSYEHQISTLSDIVDSKLEIVIDHDIAKFYQNNTNAIEEQIKNNYRYCINPRICITRTAFIQDCVTVDFKRTNEYFLPQYIDSEGDVLFYLFKTPIFLVHIHLFFVKGYPIFPQIDEFLIRMRASGIIQHLYDNASHNARLALSKKSTFKVEVLGLEQLQVAFVIWSLGVGFSVLVFVVENVVVMGHLRGRKMKLDL
ncbi:hypothetical protein Zmor_023051 [Zophobas morio]|uniref:Ionotropic receptor n=1 Tax=Zophobas morio TaxID=2755281 RepID=A0AA38HW90_9CUCU|nr:hypothetical protein Zmor_023051 [Zophobas morio]